MRKGGGFDQPLSTDNVEQNNGTTKKFADEIWPTKFPPDEYYIEALVKVTKLIEPHYSIEVHLFTDDQNPEKLAKKYFDAVADSRIKFIYRKNDNAHNRNVVEDYHAMAECDYLIRSSSLIAKASQLVGTIASVFTRGMDIGMALRQLLI